MGVSDARRLEVYEQARAHWGDGPAETLMEMVIPPGQDMATRQDVEAASGRLQERLDPLEARFDALEARIASLEERLSHVATRSFVLASQVPLYLLVVGLYFTG